MKGFSRIFMFALVFLSAGGYALSAEAATPDFILPYGIKLLAEIEEKIGEAAQVVHSFFEEAGTGRKIALSYLRGSKWRMAVLICLIAASRKEKTRCYILDEDYRWFQLPNYEIPRVYTESKNDRKKIVIEYMLSEYIIAMVKWSVMPTF